MSRRRPPAAGQKAIIDSIAKKVAGDKKCSMDHELKVMHANSDKDDWTFLKHADPLYNYYRWKVEEAGGYKKNY